MTNIRFVWAFFGLGLLAFPAAGQHLGIIAAGRAASMTPHHWSALDALRCGPEILTVYRAEAPDAAFDFAPFEEDLTAYAAGRPPLSATITAHIHTVPYQPTARPDGVAVTDRHNPFDPAFLREWSRLHDAFLAAYGQDPRLGRIYLGPPSYFGEVEYYMGPDWSDLQFLCYDPLARAAFTAWLKAKYGGLPDLSAAWGSEVTDWEAFAMPRPKAAATPHTDRAWLDLMAWRTEHLRDQVVRETRRLASGFHGEVGLKFAICDYTAMHGADSARIVAELAGTPRLALHLTNGHSLADLRYFTAIKRRYGAVALSAENDGNRFIRTEIARILLNYALAGVDEFHFSHLGHLVHAAPWNAPSETQRVLRSILPALEELHSRPPVSPVAFLHSNTTTWFRAPHYRNRDVSHVYDVALANGGRDDVRAFTWARHLCMPGVTGEQLIRDGDLADRRMLIIPNTSVTVLPEDVHDAVLNWVRDGGVLVLFGGDAFTQVLDERGAYQTATGWREGGDPEPEDGTPYTRLVRGKGCIYLFAKPAPVSPGGPDHHFFAGEVPGLLRDIALSEDVPLPFTLRDETGAPSAALALAYVGRDEARGVHRFVGGAHDGLRQVLTLTTAFEGAAELTIIDNFSAGATQSGEAVPVRRVGLSQQDRYTDPTNRETAAAAHIPYVALGFDAGEPLDLAF